MASAVGYRHRRSIQGGGTVLGCLLVAAVLSGCLNDFDEVRLNQIWIGNIDVSAPEVRSGSVTLLVNVTLENREATSGDLHLTVKAHNLATGLLTETFDTAVDPILRDRTQTVPVTLVLPKQDGYRTTAVLYQDDQRIQQASVQVSQVGALANTVFETGLRVNDLEFLVRNVSAGKIRIETQVYLTNEGASGSRPLELQLKAREVTTGLLAVEEWTDVHPIEAEATRITSLSLEVPDAYNYFVEAVLWDADFVVGKGQGKVQLLPTFTIPEDEKIVVDRPVVEDFLRDDSGANRGDSGAQHDESATPAPGVLILIGVLLAGMAWMRRRN